MEARAKRERLIEQIARVDLGRCIHFNGIQNDACWAGVNYRALVGGDYVGWALRIPCCALERRENPAECRARHLPTPEEARVTAEQHVVRLEERAAARARGECPTCKRPIEMSQVGRCVYGSCGHRLYQGRIPKNLPKIGSRQ